MRYHIGFYLLLRCTLRHLTITDSFHQARVALFFPILHPQDLPRHLTGLPWYYSEVCTLHCRDDRTRTCDLMVPNHAYYQLYYIPVAIMGESNPSQSSTHRSVSCRTSCIPTHRSAFSTKSLRLQPQGLCSRLASDRARQPSHDRCGP